MSDIVKREYNWNFNGIKHPPLEVTLTRLSEDTVQVDCELGVRYVSRWCNSYRVTSWKPGRWRNLWHFCSWSTAIEPRFEDTVTLALKELVIHPQKNEQGVKEEIDCAFKREK